jgi:hypothetical protein
MDIHAPDLAALKASLWKRAEALKNPPANDELLRTIYRTPEIRGDIVLAGQTTRTTHPITELPEYRIHFVKTNLGDPELDTKEEYIKHSQIYESWKAKNPDNSPIPIPRPLAYGPTTFRSELIFGITVAAASPCKIKKGQPPQTLEDWIHLLSPLISIPLDWQKKYWDGLSALSLAILHMQSLNHVAHKDLHKENLMLVPFTESQDKDSKDSRDSGDSGNSGDSGASKNKRTTQTKTSGGARYLPALIDFETAKFDPEARERQSDFHYLLHEARLMLAGPLRDDPTISNSQLAQITLQQAHRSFSAFDLNCLQTAEKTIRQASTAVDPKIGGKKPGKKTPGI